MHQGRTEQPRPVPPHLRVEPMRRRQVEFSRQIQVRIVQDLRLGLPRVVDGRGQRPRELLVEPQLQAGLTDRARLRNAFLTAAWRPLPPPMITSRPWEISSPRSSSERRNGVNTCAFSVSVSTKPKKRFSPQSVMPRATTIVASANVFPSRNSATASSPVGSRSCISRSFAALPCTNPRDTVELDSPMAPGITSAAAS